MKQRSPNIALARIDLESESIFKMNIQSLGYRTDLFFPRFDGEIEDCGDFLAVRSPSNPSYYWGNFLLFAAPPAEGNLERWQELFARKIGAPPTVQHFAFGWDGTAGELGAVTPFLNAGFTVEDSVILTAREVIRPAKYNEEIVVRVLMEDWEWEAALENQVIGRDPAHDEAGWRVFAARRMSSRRAMARTGLGNWFGAFLDGVLIGNLGVFVEDGVGRFQSVGTHPDFRRRGVCGALVHQVSQRCLGEMGAHLLVMQADPHYHAARIYESIGFAPVERQSGVVWWSRAGNPRETVNKTADH